MSLPYLRLKKNEDRRIRAGHPWIYSNEIDIVKTPLKNFSSGEQVLVETHDKTFIGVAYINPHSLIAARLFSRVMSDRLNIDFFKSKLQQAYQLRHYLFDLPYYRLVFSEADQLPGLIIDRFDKDFVFQINTKGLEDKQDDIAAALNDSIKTRSILLRNDSPIRKQEGLDNYIRPLDGKPPDEIQLIENGIHFTAPLYQGQKTGWFYDHRLTRARLKDYVKDKHVLDVFAYLGGFGVQAAAWGAKSVDFVESSEFATHYIEKNAALNNIDHNIHIYCEDAFLALKECLHQKKRYDVIIIDPPAFVKKAKDRKAGLIAYQRVNELAIKLLVSNGILVSCSCSMHVTMEDLIRILNRVAYRAQSKLQILERTHQGPDHPVHIAIPETDYLKALFVRKIE